MPGCYSPSSQCDGRRTGQLAEGWAGAEEPEASGRIAREMAGMWAWPSRLGVAATQLNEGRQAGEGLPPTVCHPRQFATRSEHTARSALKPALVLCTVLVLLYATLNEALLQWKGGYKSKDIIERDSMRIQHKPVEKVYCLLSLLICTRVSVN